MAKLDAKRRGGAAILGVNPSIRLPDFDDSAS
jgi:hypothetical protein